jgi:GNAT superfamily N-acetyltransferase
MKIYSFSPQDLQRIRAPIIRFMKKYGDGRITHHALRWLQHLHTENWAEGTWIAATLDGKKITGVIVFGNFGIDEGFIAVHPDYRKKGIGETLLKSTMEKLPKIYTRVACDNIPSLKLCFSCGLVAFHLFKGPTGKPTLWLAGGNWNPQDVIKQKSENKPFA